MAMSLNQRIPSLCDAPCDAITGDQMLARIDALAPVIAGRAPQIEQDRRLPADIVDALKSARVFSMMVPRRFGGVGLDLPDALRAISALARLEGAVGWNAMIGQIGSLIPFLLSETLCRQIIRPGMDHILAGSVQPNGKAERVPNGWKVSGRWPFASGCLDAGWIGAACIMMERDTAIPEGDGAAPMIRFCVMPAERWQIHDTWRACGLRGTGSHDVALQDVFVPEDNICAFPIATSFAPDAVFEKCPELMVLSHGAFAVGVATGAVDDLVALAASGAKQQRMVVALAETERFKEGLAQLAAGLAAARALLETEAARVWQSNEQATARDMGRLGELQGLGTWIVARCLRVTEACFELAGSRAVHEGSPLQRRLRDLRVASSHGTVHPRNYVPAGAALITRLMSQQKTAAIEA